jgi:hypothetical protein
MHGHVQPEDEDGDHALHDMQPCAAVVSAVTRQMAAMHLITNQDIAALTLLTSCIVLRCWQA